MRVVALVVLIILIGFFWYVGKQNTQNQTSEPDLIYTNPEILAQKEQEKKLIEFIETRMTEQGGLQSASSSDFNPQVVFTDKNIITSADNSQNSLKKYGLNLKTALGALGEVSLKEANLTVKAITDQDPTQLVGIKSRSGEFHYAIRQLASTTVPTKATNIHLTLINSLAHLANLLDQMALALQEPLVALEAAKMYSVDSIEFYNVVIKINQFFTENKIVFTEAELLPPKPTNNQ